MTDHSDIRRLLEERLDGIDLDPTIPPHVLHRARRRRLIAGLLAGGAVLLIVAGGSLFASTILSPRNAMRPVGPAPHTTTPAPSPTGARSCAWGPWAQHCAEADWARAVIRDAGFDVVGDTGSAIVGRRANLEFHFWAFVPRPDQRPLVRAIEDEGYRGLHRPAVYSDGIRFVWATRGVYVWLRPSKGSWEQIGRQILDPLVVSSNEVSLVGRFRPQAPPAQTAADYGLLYASDDLNVYAPAWGQAWGACPTDAIPLGTADLADAERAALAAIPVLIEQGVGWQDSGGAEATSDLAHEAGKPPDFERMIAKDCGSTAVQGTAVVTVHLPRVQSASMSAATLFVSKEPRGWVMWHWPT